MVWLLIVSEADIVSKLYLLLLYVNTIVNMSNCELTAKKNLQTRTLLSKGIYCHLLVGSD